MERKTMKKILALAIAAGLAFGSSAFAQAPNFDDPEQFALQQAQLAATPQGPADMPWEQYLIDSLKDTASMKKDGPYTVCFSNAGVNNPWRVVGFTDMTEEVKLHADIAEFIHVDAEGSDDKQIADIDDLLAGGKCSILIVSPNTTAALTPAVEKACATLPVIVFDRGVNTDCPVTFVHPVGGYGFGIQGAEFIAANVAKPVAMC
jgi:ribose transport system substrate-binding protein